MDHLKGNCELKDDGNSNALAFSIVAVDGHFNA